LEFSLSITADKWRLPDGSAAEKVTVMHGACIQDLTTFPVKMDLVCLFEMERNPNGNYYLLDLAMYEKVITKLEKNHKFLLQVAIQQESITLS